MSIRKLCTNRFINPLDKTFCRYYSERKLTNAEIRKKRNALFEEEKARQLSLVTRIEKIEVKYGGHPEPCTLVMNKGLSTPYHCTMHMQELLMERSVVAKVNGKLWDMHRPLEEDCTLELLHFLEEAPFDSNDTFWRSMSFVLGHILETGFKDSIMVDLCSFPRPNVRSGSFVYDANLGTATTDYTINESVLRGLSAIGYRLGSQNLPLEPLYIDISIAEKMFEDNKYKFQQLKSVASRSVSKSKVKVYRMGDHIDMSSGPLMASSSHIGAYRVTGIHPIASGYGQLHRVQGLAIPKVLKLHYWAVDQLTERASKLNVQAALPYIRKNKVVTEAIAKE
ncbi:39S ribosomal protein L39, mitochondrial-like [Mizuhopecten yessoensis]|uniref:39S ribosomal protein L39, mitochondrial n=1 Tax=Mizuhopecten yessoensis TaxID=6573 RepID=A0A210PHL5_MIZYE|nr:39S ribosomal protein L39, mitochondrial-like [Mizuhopecten yessoensis]OWF35972.1 39S ribosomal protein L39, mitochondrial [Mizuhopecten yessoensis]